MAGEGRQRQLGPLRWRGEHTRIGPAAGGSSCAARQAATALLRRGCHASSHCPNSGSCPIPPAGSSPVHTHHQQVRRSLLACRRQLLPQRGRIIALRVNVVDARALMSGSPVLIVVCSAVRKRPLRVRPAGPAVGAPPLAVATRKCGWQCSAELLARRNVRLFGSAHWQPHLKS